MRKLSLLLLLILTIPAFTQTSVVDRNISAVPTVQDVGPKYGLLMGDGGTNNSPYYWNWDGQKLSASSEARKDDGKGPTLAEVEKSKVALLAKNMPSDRYIKLAEDLRFGKSPITDKIYIEKALMDLDIKVYDPVKVDGYLYRRALRQGANTRWIWEPMREVDWLNLDRDGATGWSVNLLGGSPMYEKYARAIPISALETIKLLIDKLDKVEPVFLVSDYAVRNPDPFLAITTVDLMKSGVAWIIARWNEPGYAENQ